MRVGTTALSPAARRVTALSSDQVILMSAHCTPDIAKEALDIGTYRVVNKPIDMDETSRFVGSFA
jgi:DNA-binding NtrC family response regulator